MHSLALLPSVGPVELILILLIVVIIFGVGKLPEIGGALGKSIREFKRSTEGLEEEPGTEKAKEPESAEKKE